MASAQLIASDLSGGHRESGMNFIHGGHKKEGMGLSAFWGVDAASSISGAEQLALISGLLDPCFDPALGRGVDLSDLQRSLPSSVTLILWNHHIPARIFLRCGRS